MIDCPAMGLRAMYYVAPPVLDLFTAFVPATVCYRVAAAAGWQAGFSLLWDRTVVSRGEMEAAIVAAGQFVGVGNGRSIGFGRFAVEAFAVEEQAVAG